MEKIVECPNCKKLLKVGNPNNLELRIINCPNCKYPLRVTFPTPLDAHTYLAPQKNNIDGGETQLAAPKQQSSSVSLVYKDVNYPLEDGQNIIGRKGSSSMATIQIASEDRTMSRQHCCIQVSTLPDGSKKAVLSNYQNKNMTIVDGQEVENGDEIRLTDGNRITMGQTTITFKLS